MMKNCPACQISNAPNAKKPLNGCFQYDCACGEQYHAKTVKSSRTCPCPVTCPFRYTNVLHYRHEESVDVEVVTLAEAARRLDLVIDWQGNEYLKNVEVAFNDVKNVNYFCGGKVEYSFDGVWRTSWGNDICGRGYCVSRQPDGRLEIARPM